jgi:hypothetical protein
MFCVHLVFVRSCTASLGFCSLVWPTLPTTSRDDRRLLAGELLARLNSVRIQHVLERKQECRGDDALSDLGSNAYRVLAQHARPEAESSLTSVQTTVSLLANDPLERRHHALPLAVSARNMHPALHRDVRVGDAGREQLAQGAEVEGVLGCDPALLLEEVLHLLEHGVLQDGVDDEDKRGRDTSEQTQRALVADQSEQGSECRGRLRRRAARQDLLVRLGFARRHACVDDPDGVCEQHGGRPGDGACDHGLDRCELARGPAGFERGFLEEGACPFIPLVVSVLLHQERRRGCTVVVDEVGHGDAEQSGIHARIQPRDALALDDAACSAQCRGLGALRLDLRAGREGDERVGQGHGEQSSTRSGERVRDIVALLGCRALGYRLR